MKPCSMLGSAKRYHRGCAFGPGLCLEKDRVRTLYLTLPCSYPGNTSKRPRSPPGALFVNSPMTVGCRTLCKYLAQHLGSGAGPVGDLFR